MDILPPRDLHGIEEWRRGEALVRSSDVPELKLCVGGKIGVNNLQTLGIAQNLLYGLGYEEVVLTYYDMQIFHF